MITGRDTRVTLHDIELGVLVGEGDSGDHIGTEINAENEDGREGLGDLEHHEEEEGGDLGDVGGQGVGDRFLQVIEDKTTLFDTFDNGREVIIEEKHIGGVLSDLRAGTHSDTDVSLLDGGGIVDTVTSDGDDVTEYLASLNDLELLGGGCPSEHDFRLADPVHDDTAFLGLLIIHGLFGGDDGGELVTVDDNSFALGKGLFLGVLAVGAGLDLLEHFVEFHIGLSNDVNLMGNGGSSWGLITSDHNDFDSSELAGSDGDVDLRAGRIVEGNEADKGQAPHGEPAGTLLGVGGSFIALVNGIGLLVTEANPVLGGEGVLTLGEVLRGELSLGESENTLSHQTEAIVGSLYVELDSLVESFVDNFAICASKHNVVAALEDLLGSTLEVDGHVFSGSRRVIVAKSVIADHAVELDGGVERDGVLVLLCVHHGGVGSSVLVEPVVVFIRGIDIP